MFTLNIVALRLITFQQRTERLDSDVILITQCQVNKESFECRLLQLISGCCFSVAPFNLHTVVTYLESRLLTIPNNTICR